MATAITPGQDCDYTGDDLVMADTLPQPIVMGADMGCVLIESEKT